MTLEHRPSAEDQKTEREDSRHHKKPYEKPAFRYEKVFETMALACGKVAPTQNTCRRHNRKNS